MQNFEYNTPTKVVFGRDTEARVGELVRAAGGSKVLLHYGSGSAKKSGLLDRVSASLTAAGVAFVELGGVVPNPRLALVRQGIELGRAEAVDFILAVGGGSVIDSAKAIGYGLANEGDVWDFYEGTRAPAGMMPVGAVLTIAAAGSEMSNSSVISDEQQGKKRGLNSEHGRCRFAVMNPALTLTLPAYETACGCVDILMHTLERYFTAESNTMELTDSIAEALMRTVINNAQMLAREPQSYDARAEMMWAGALSHNGLTGCGNGGGDWAVHQLGHELSARYDLAHGAALSVLWASWARYVLAEDPARFARLAVEVLGLDPEEGDETDLAEAGISELEGLFWALEMPTSLAELGYEIGDADLQQMAAGCSRGGTRTVGGLKKLTEADMLNIYRMASQPAE